MKRLLLIALLLMLAVPVLAQEATEAPTPEATETPAPEATAEATLSPYAWCGYLLLDQVIMTDDELALLASLFPTDDSDAPPDALMQWRPRPDGAGGILEGCHLLPVERWRVVSLLQQASGMAYDQMDESLVLTIFASVDEVRAYLDEHTAEWEAPLETPTAVPADS